MPRYRTCIDRGAVCTGTRCPEHARARNNSTARGYGAEHQRQRAELKATLPGPCQAAIVCGGVQLKPDGDWVAAHLIDGDPESPRIAACRRCNEAMKRR